MELKYLTLDQLKTQCSVDKDDDFYDDALMEAGATAEAVILNEIHMTSEDAFNKWGNELPQPLIHAMLMMTANFFKYREPGTPEAVKEVPWGLKTLILPYVKLTARYD